MWSGKKSPLPVWRSDVYIETVVLRINFLEVSLCVQFKGSVPIEFECNAPPLLHMHVRVRVIRLM